MHVDGTVYSRGDETLGQRLAHGQVVGETFFDDEDIYQVLRIFVDPNDNDEAVLADVQFLTGDLGKCESECLSYFFYDRVAVPVHVRELERMAKDVEEDYLL